MENIYTSQGKGRAWFRIALNEQSLSKLLKMLLSDAILIRYCILLINELMKRVLVYYDNKKYFYFVTVVVIYLIAGKKAYPLTQTILFSKSITELEFTKMIVLFYFFLT